MGIHELSALIYLLEKWKKFEMEKEDERVFARDIEYETYGDIISNVKWELNNKLI